MTGNVGGIDRVLRILVGLGLLSLVFVGPQTPWGWIGAIVLLTGLRLVPGVPAVRLEHEGHGRLMTGSQRGF